MTTPYQHAIWDWNGTLLDDTRLCVEVLNGLLAGRGAEPVSETDYRRNFCFPVIRFYEHLGLDTDEESFDRFSREFISVYEARWFEECALHSHAAETLRALSRLGMSHSVLSAAKQEALDRGIRHFGLGEHFTGLVGTDNIHARGKIEQGRKWIAELGRPPGEVVLIGDTLHDLEVAEAIGIDCVLVTHGHHSAERLAASGAVVVDSLPEVIEVLQAKAGTI